ncbi:kelch domain-containing protein 10 [Ciona intestinalis]
MKGVLLNQFNKLEPKNQGHSCSLPVARSGHRCVADDNNLWVFGGYNPDIRIINGQPSDGLLREMWKFNLTTKVWKQLPSHENMPAEVASHAVFRHGKHMLVFGGTGFPFGETSSNKLSVCHLPTGQWRLLNCNGSVPDPVYGQAITVVDSDLYVYGGTAGRIYNSDVHKLNLNELTWTSLKPNNPPEDLPFERYRHEIVVYDGKLYVLGGGTSTQVFPLLHVHVYSITNNTWTTVRTEKRPDSDTTVPKPRRCHSCVQFGDKAFICGGYNGRTIYGDLWQLHLPTLVWTKIADMPEPVFFHSAAITPEGCMLVTGGNVCISPTIRTNSSYSIWLTVPSLQTLCWHKLIETMPQLLSMTKKQLLELGINEHFVKKLECAIGA